MTLFCRDENVQQTPAVEFRRKKQDAPTVLDVAAQAVNALFLLLYPFMPETSKRILEMVGVEVKHSWTGEKPWQIAAATPIKKPTPLFEKLTDEKLKIMKQAQTAV